jgi:hypothetical protein
MIKSKLGLVALAPDGSASNVADATNQIPTRETKINRLRRTCLAVATMRLGRQPPGRYMNFRIEIAVRIQNSDGGLTKETPDTYRSSLNHS